MEAVGSDSAPETLARRIVAAPRLAAPAGAHVRVGEWLAEVSHSAAGAKLARLIADHSSLRALIAGIAEGAPYLWDLARRSPERLVALLEAEPLSRFDAILAGATQALTVTSDEAE